MMRRLAVLALLAMPLGGCAVADFFANLAERETPLPGERKQVFPGGVPGVQQGVPAEYLRPADPPPATTATPPAEPAPRT
jgi:hypothetical protein